MKPRVKDFIDFWVQNSVHAKPSVGSGSSQDASELVQRLLAMAEQEGISREDIVDEIGDPLEFLMQKLNAVNSAETKSEG